jgi:very-short-patch-repair endonuclease
MVVATEALADGSLTRRDLNRRYTKLHRNMYVRVDVELTACDRAYAAWLWSGRKATLVGHSAAAWLGSKWIPADAPVELAHSRRPACATAARTGYDLGRRISLETAVIRMDALLNSTRVSPAAVEKVARRHPGARGIRRLRHALILVDGGSESPQETRLRLLVVKSGLPRPVTQIPVRNQSGRVVRRIDMGWPDWKVGIEYDGEQHWTDPEAHAGDIERLEFLAARGWSIVRVSAAQLRERRADVVSRARRALQERGFAA